MNRIGLWLAAAVCVSARAADVRLPPAEIRPGSGDYAQAISFAILNSPTAALDPALTHLTANGLPASPIASLPIQDVLINDLGLTPEKFRALPPAAAADALSLAAQQSRENASIVSGQLTGAIHELTQSDKTISTWHDRRQLIDALSQLQILREQYGYLLDDDAKKFNDTYFDRGMEAARREALKKMSPAERVRNDAPKPSVKRTVFWGATALKARESLANSRADVPNSELIGLLEDFGFRLKNSNNHLRFHHADFPDFFFTLPNHARAKAVYSVLVVDATREVERRYAGLEVAETLSRRPAREEIPPLTLAELRSILAPAARPAAAASEPERVERPAPARPTPLPVKFSAARPLVAAAPTAQAPAKVAVPAPTPAPAAIPAQAPGIGAQVAGMIRRWVAVILPGPTVPPTAKARKTAATKSAKRKRR